MEKKLSKSALARSLGVSRSSLYYKPRRPAKDEVLRERILASMSKDHTYGHRMIALDLHINKKCVYRVMKKYGIKPQLVRKKPKYGRKTSVSGIPNRIKGISPIAPNVIWVGDFTYLHFHGRMIYLATVMDRYTREIVAWQIGLHHTTQLILDVLKESVRRRVQKPYIFHSDQGSEYTAGACIDWLVSHKILPSHSPKGKPWNNGHQESFYSHFKFRFGSPSRCSSIETLIEEIGKHIHHYNSIRIHSALKMPPKKFYLQEMELKNAQKSEAVGV